MRPAPEGQHAGQSPSDGHIPFLHDPYRESWQPALFLSCDKWTLFQGESWEYAGVDWGASSVLDGSGSSGGNIAVENDKNDLTVKRLVPPPEHARVLWRTVKVVGRDEGLSPLHVVSNYQWFVANDGRRPAGYLISPENRALEKERGYVVRINMFMYSVGTARNSWGARVSVSGGVVSCQRVGDTEGCQRVGGVNVELWKREEGRGVTFPRRTGLPMVILTM